MKKIAISGKMASGKTSVSDHLINTYGYKRYSIAEKVKEFGKEFAMYNKNYGIENLRNKAYNNMYDILVHLDPTNKLGNKTRLLDYLHSTYLSEFIHIADSSCKTDDVRGLLQIIGNKFREAMFEDVWVEETINRLDSELCVIDDMRYKNEFNALRAAGFIIVRLEVSPEVQKARLNKLYGNIPQEKLEHISEIDLDGMSFDCVINSDQNLETVIYALKYIMEK